MGITGLIPFLEKASQPCNVSQFSGCTVAVDAYCWLHKGAFACADKLARGDHCTQYVMYCMKYVNLLLHHNIKPILVFDGRHLNAKADTENKRRESRELNRRKAAELLRLDRANEAKTYLRRCVDVTHEMALNLIQECRARNVDCIVAPYEADAQLAYFSINNIAHVIITEDSDLLLFGCKKVLFKMDLNGGGLLIEQNKLYLAMGIKEDSFSLDKFRYMCILSGCDYLSSLPGIGLAKACRFITRSVDPDIHKALSRLPIHLNMSQLCVTQEYRDKFMEADLVFRYQPVFDPFSRKVITLNPPPEGESLPALWTPLSDDLAEQLAFGNIDPFSLKQMDNWDPKEEKAQLKKSVNWNGRAPHKSIWSTNYLENMQKSQEEVKNKKKNAGAFVIERPSTLGKEVTQKSQTPTKKRSAENFEDEKHRLAQLYGGNVDLKPSLKKLCKEEDVDLKIEEDPSRIKNTNSSVLNPFVKAKSKYSPVTFKSGLSKMSGNQKKTAVDSSRKIVSGYFFSGSDPKTETLNESTSSTSSLLQTDNCLENSSSEKKESSQEDSLTDKQLSNLFNRQPLKDIKNTSPVSSPEKENSFNLSPAKSPEILTKKFDKKPLNPFVVKKNLDSSSSQSLLESFDDSNTSNLKNESAVKGDYGFSRKDESLIKEYSSNNSSSQELSEKEPVTNDSNSMSSGCRGNFKWSAKFDKYKSVSSYGKSSANSQEFKNPVQSVYHVPLSQESREEEDDPLSAETTKSFSQESDEGFCSPSLIKTPPETIIKESKSSSKKTMSQLSCRQTGLSKKRSKQNLLSKQKILSKQNVLSDFFFKPKAKMSS